MKNLKKIKIIWVIVLLVISLFVVGGGYYYKYKGSASPVNNIKERVLSSHYKILNGQVLYNDDIYQNSNGWTPIPLADHKSFEVVFDEYRIATKYAKDAKYVFQNNKILADIDPQTFSISTLKVASILGDNSILEDKDNTYVCNGKQSIDRNNFKILGDVFVTDGIHIYDLNYDCKTFDDLDPQSFKQFSLESDQLFGDNKTIYIHDSFDISKFIKINVDPPSFKYFGFSIAKDKLHVYSFRSTDSLKSLADISVDNFQYVGNFYFKNNEAVYRVVYNECAKSFCSYFELMKVDDADPNSFVSVGIKDNIEDNVYSTTSDKIDAKDQKFSYSNGTVLNSGE